jgi:hypothetical protein
LKIGLETQVKKAIGFVEDQDLKRGLGTVDMRGREKLNESTGRRYENIWTVSEEETEILRRGRGASNEQLGYNGWGRSGGTLFIALEVWEDFGGCFVELQQREQHCMDLGSQFARR